MKQVIARGGQVTVVDVPEPVCGDKEVLVRTAFSVISTGTETWAIDSTTPLSASDIAKSSSMLEKATRLSRDVLAKEGASGLLDYAKAVRNPEVPLGYSSAGTVIEVGRGVVDIVVGDEVVCAGEGKACHAELVAVPRNLLTKIDGGVPMSSAAFSTIGAIAVHAVRTSGAALGETVGVIGAGLVGNIVTQVAKAAGCRVVCIDLKEERLELARKVGADLTLKADEPALTDHVLHYTRGRGLDHVLVCAAASSSDPLNLAARISRNRGTVTVVGRVGMDIDRKDFFQKELRLLMSRSLGPGRYDPVYEEKGVDYPLEYVRWTLNRNMEAFLDLLQSGKVDVEKLVGAEFPLDNATRAYDELGKQGKVAVLLTYPRKDSAAKEAPSPARATAGPRAPVNGAVNVAVVGPGNFAKETILPLLRSSPDYHLRWVVSSNPLHATQVARRYGAEKSTCSLAEALADADLHAVVITAPNKMHFPMMAEAVAAGKIALVEKPLCISRAELEKAKALHLESGAPVLVGFNRRYAPLVTKMKARMKGMDGPFLIDYRVNAGFVAGTRWSQDAEVGGGRIVHECCHFFDLFNFLLEESNPEITVQTAGINGSSSVARDNISVSLKYPSGSLATLVYVSMGSKAMDRERIEVFAQGSSMVLDDFKELVIYGAASERRRLKKAEKGHKEEFAELAKSIHGLPNSLITTEEVLSATELTFKVDEAVRGLA
ncbi:MAG: bi-domain-containing oxidoreductase [Thaumarchaeota archaeon]|nr:bi-domain-containing oxidoreductase [Nitrososphaerota archaeon]